MGERKISRKIQNTDRKVGKSISIWVYQQKNTNKTKVMGIEDLLAGYKSNGNRKSSCRFTYFLIELYTISLLVL